MIAWRVWPLKRSPGRGALTALLLAGTWYGVWDWTEGDPWLTALAVVVLSLAVVPFFIPTSYRLSGNGVEIHRPWRTWRRPWSDFRGVRADRNVVVLSPWKNRSWLDGFRGETLLFEDNRQEVLPYVEKMVGEAHASGD